MGTKNKRAGEEPKVGFPIHRPMRKTKGGEQVTWTNGACKVRGFPKGPSRQRVGTRED